MPGESLVLDPYTESPSNAPLWLHSRSNATLAPGVFLSADGGHQYPPPEPDSVWVSSPETEGDIRGMTRPQRRVISVKLQIVEPTDAALVNRCTNPTFGFDTTGWTNNSLPLFQRVVLIPTLGGTLHMLPGFDTALNANGDASGDNASTTFSVTSAVPVTFSAWVYSVSTPPARLEVWNTAPALFANSAAAIPDRWNRLSVTFTPNASGTWTFRVAQSGAGAMTTYFTGVQIGPPDPYFDGDTPGCYWVGTRNASISQRRAPGGTRYAGIKADIEDKLAKLNAEGGTYRRTLPTGERITFDVQEARLMSWQEDPLAETYRYTKCEIEFACKPYGRGVTVDV
jgi:hypothetical protein